MNKMKLGLKRPHLLLASFAGLAAAAGLSVAAVPAEPTPTAFKPGTVTLYSGTIVDQEGSHPLSLLSLVLEETTAGIVFVECLSEICSRNTYAGGIVPRRFGPFAGEAFQDYAYQGDLAAALSALAPRSSTSFPFKETIAGQAEPAIGTLELRIGELAAAGADGASTVLIDVIHHYKPGDTTARSKLELPGRRLLAFDYDDPIDTVQQHLTLTGSAKFESPDWRQRVDNCIAKDPKNLGEFCGCGLLELSALCATVDH